jgi:hypothetical protein
MKYLILLLALIMLASCNPDDTTIPTPSEKKLLFSKITFVPDNPADPSYSVWPSYDANGFLTSSKTVYSSAPNDTFTDIINETASLLTVNFHPQSAFNPVLPYRNIRFHMTIGRLDSIIYNEQISIPYMGGGYSKRVFEYNGDNLSKVKDYEFSTDKLLKSSEYSSLEYVNGLLTSFVLDSTETTYQKVTYSYFPESEWNADPFNTYYFTEGPVGYGLLFITPSYFHPILMNGINFMGNQRNALIKNVRYTGYYFESGVKKDFDYQGDINYVFDAKGRVIDAPNRYNFAGKPGRLKFEYKD